jgi:hypothetical protein
MNIVKLEATMEDGSVVTVFPVATPVTATVAEVDVKMTDGSVEVTKPVPENA